MMMVHAVRTEANPIFSTYPNLIGLLVALQHDGRCRRDAARQRVHWLSEEGRTQVFEGTSPAL